MTLPEEFQSVDFLQALGQPYINQLAVLAQVKEYDEGDIIFHEGQACPFIYFILRGEVALEVEEANGETAPVNVAGPGDLLGWSPILGRHAMTATARVKARSRLALYNVRQIQNLCEQDPYFGVAFLRQVAGIMSDRLRGTRRQLARALRHQSLLATATAPEGSD